MFKWLMMGLICAMFSVAQVSADEASMAEALAEAQQTLADNPDMSGEDLVDALIDAGIDPADAAVAAINLKPAEKEAIQKVAMDRAKELGLNPGAVASAIAAATTPGESNKSPINNFGDSGDTSDISGVAVAGAGVTGAGAGGGGTASDSQ